MKTKFKRSGSKYISTCGRFEIRHTGTQGRSTRIFTGYDNGQQIGNSGGLIAVKKQIEAFLAAK